MKKMQKTWGEWEYDATLLTLTHRKEGYEIDLETCTTSAEVLDWICQVAQKGFCLPQDVGDLVQAINALINPQSCLCSFGKECGPIDVKKHIRHNRKAGA